jgi:hypothetical protein
MAIALEIMSADDFSNGVKLNKFSFKRWKQGDAHPLKQIHRKLDELHKMNKGKLDLRHNLMKEIATACVKYAGGKAPGKQTSSKLKTVLRLARQATYRGMLERERGKEIAAQLKSGPGKGLVGELMYESLNKEGQLGLRGDELVQLAKTHYGVELTGDDEKDFYAMKKVLKASKSDFAEQMNLVYMNAEQRAESQLVFTDSPGKGLVLKNDEPYTTLFTKEGGKRIEGDVGDEMYAIDPIDGNIYSAHENKYKTDHNIFHHSSFLAGRKALCAGLIKVKDGRLLEITDESGHYKPQLENLLAACEVIVNTGYDPAPEGHVLINDWEEKWLPKTRSQMGQMDVPEMFRIPIKVFVDANGEPKNMTDFNWGRVQERGLRIQGPREGEEARLQLAEVTR